MYIVCYELNWTLVYIFKTFFGQLLVWLAKWYTYPEGGYMWLIQQRSEFPKNVLIMYKSIPNLTIFRICAAVDGEWGDISINGKPVWVEIIVILKMMKDRLEDGEDCIKIYCGFHATTTKKRCDLHHRKQISQAICDL